MSEAKVFVGGAWSPLCDIKYNKYVSGQFESFYDRPITFYNDNGDPYLFECTQQVVGVSLSSSAIIDETSIEINWFIVQDPNDPQPLGDTFDVYDADTDTLIASDITDQFYEHTGLNTGQQYCYYVIAKATGYDDSDPSNTQCFTTAIYQTPNDVVIQDCQFRDSLPSGEAILVRFMTAEASDPPVDYYRLWYRLTGGDGIFNPFGIPTLQHNDDDTLYRFEIEEPDLITGEEYRFVVEAVGPGGSSTVDDTLACVTFYDAQPNPI